jgi:hypothetical protein
MNSSILVSSVNELIHIGIMEMHYHKTILHQHQNEHQHFFLLSNFHHCLVSQFFFFVIKFHHNVVVINLCQRIYETHNIDFLLPTELFLYARVINEVSDHLLKYLNILLLDQSIIDDN